VIRAPKHPVVLRTDFTDDAAWKEIAREIALPIGPEGFLATVVYIDDPAYAEVNEANVRGSLSGYQHSFIVLADAGSMTRADHPLLVVDLSSDDEPSFRAAPRSVQAIEHNLTTGTMDFAEFGEVADEEEDGVFRAFADHTSLN
jgi:hypothetical protein